MTKKYVVKVVDLLNAGCMLVQCKFETNAVVFLKVTFPEKTMFRGCFTEFILTFDVEDLTAVYFNEGQYLSERFELFLSSFDIPFTLTE